MRYAIRTAMLIASLSACLVTGATALLFIVAVARLSDPRRMLPLIKSLWPIPAALSLLDARAGVCEPRRRKEKRE